MPIVHLTKCLTQITFSRVKLHKTVQKVVSENYVIQTLYTVSVFIQSIPHSFVFIHVKEVLLCPFIWFLGCPRIGFNRCLIVPKTHFFLFSSCYTEAPTSKILIGQLAQCVVIGEPLQACSGNVTFLTITMPWQQHFTKASLLYLLQCSSTSPFFFFLHVLWAGIIQMSDFVVSQDPEEVHCSLKEPVVVGNESVFC